jgi:hypothetical protein
MPSKQNFASILKSLKSDNSKSMLHPINESTSEDYILHDSKYYKGDSLVKRNTVKFAYELNPLPEPLPLTQSPTNDSTKILRTKIKKVSEKHFSNIYYKKNTAVCPLVKEPFVKSENILKFSPVSKKDPSSLKSVYFPNQAKQVNESSSHGSSKLIHLNKKVIIVPQTPMFETASRTSSEVSYMSTKTSNNTINHFFPKLMSKPNQAQANSESLVAPETSSTGFNYSFKSISQPSLVVEKQAPSTFGNPTNSTEPTSSKSKLKIFGTIRICDPASATTNDQSFTMPNGNINCGILKSPMASSRRLPFLDNIYVKPHFAHYEKKFFSRNMDILQNMALAKYNKLINNVTVNDSCLSS